MKKFKSVLKKQKRSHNAETACEDYIRQNLKAATRVQLHKKGKCS